MSETKLTYNTVESLPVLEEVPENATLLAVVDGEFYRVPGDMVGGSSCDAIIDVTGTGSEVSSDLAAANLHFGVGSYAAIIEKFNKGEAASVHLRGTYMYGDIESKWESPCLFVDYVPGLWLGLVFLVNGNSLEIWFDGDGNLDI